MSDWHINGLAEGSTTPSNEVAIQQLQAVGTAHLGDNIYLDMDVDLSGVSWESIGDSSSSYFHGNFYGQGHTIKNMYISKTNADFATGLFAYVTGTENKHVKITNLKIDNCNIVNTGSSSSSSIMGFIGFSNGYVDINNCNFNNINIQLNRDTQQTTGGGINTLINIVSGYVVVSDCDINIIFKSTGVNPRYYNVGGVFGGIDSGNALIQNTKINYNVNGEGELGTRFGSISPYTYNTYELNVINCVSLSNYPISIDLGQGSLIVSGYYVGGGSGTDKDSRVGLGVTSSEYNTETWWRNIVFGTTDYDANWYWDNTAQLPKLIAFMPQSTTSISQHDESLLAHAVGLTGVM